MRIKILFSLVTLSVTATQSMQSLKELAAREYSKNVPLILQDLSEGKLDTDTQDVIKQQLINKYYNNKYDPLFPISASILLKGHTEGIKSVAFSYDGKYALTGSQDHTARLWDLATGETIQVLIGHTHIVSSVAFSPCDKYALTAAQYDNAIRLWDLAAGKTIALLQGHTFITALVAFSHDGRYVLTGSHERDAYLWDLHNLTAGSVVLHGHTNFVSLGAFSPDGNYVLTGSADGTARLWDLKTGQTVQVLIHSTKEYFNDSIIAVFFIPGSHAVEYVYGYLYLCFNSNSY